MRRALFLWTVILVAGLCITGCGDSDDGANKVEKTVLELGERAKITDSKGTYELEVTIEAEVGRRDDLREQQLDPQQSRMTPWYVRYEFKNTGSNDVTRKSGFGLDPNVREDDGRDALKLEVTGDLPVCEPVDAPDPFDVGDSFETCDVYLVRSHASLGEIVIEEHHDDAADEQYIWRVS